MTRKPGRAHPAKAQAPEPADLSKPVTGTDQNLRKPEVTGTDRNVRKREPSEAQVRAAVADPFGHMVGQLGRADLVRMEAP